MVFPLPKPEPYHWSGGKEKADIPQGPHPGLGWPIPYHASVRRSRNDVVAAGGTFVSLYNPHEIPSISLVFYALRPGMNGMGWTQKTWNICSRSFPDAGGRT